MLWLGRGRPASWQRSAHSVHAGDHDAPVIRSASRAVSHDGQGTSSASTSIAC